MVKRIELPNNSEILIGRGIIGACGSVLTRLEKGTRCVVVSDSNVAPIYAENVLDALTDAGYQASLFIFEAGEKSKHIGTVTQILDFFCERNLTRHDFVVALGGGVTGDLAGFAASIYLRGISVIQIPTSLLAQIDSSIGGKTGCDTAQGKNLIGSFHMPHAVLIDPDVLSTLPDKYMTDGMGEMIKYGAILSEDFFKKLESTDLFSDIDENIYTCAKLKADLVCEDYKEKNKRTLLNFGHTVGHALERIENYQGISHGAAVAIGMCVITRAAEKFELCQSGTADRIKALCEKYSLPTDYTVSALETEQAALTDKKRVGGRVKLALIRKIGDGFICPIACNKLHEFIDECINID